MKSDGLFNSHKLKNIVFNCSYYSLNVLFPLLTYPYVARILGVDNIGLGNLAISLATYFATIASLGIPIYGIREVAKCRDNSEKLSFLVSELILINAIGVMASIILYALLILHVDIFRENLFIYILAGINLFFSFFQIDWLFQGTERFKILMYRNFIVKLASIFLVYYLISERNDVEQFVFISVFGLSLANLINILEASKIVRFRFHCLNLRRHIKTIIFFSATRIVSTVYTVLDSVILGLLTSNFYVGLYSTAIKLIRVVVTIISSITMVFFADTARQVDVSEDTRVDRLTDLFIFIFLLCVPIALFLFLFSDAIVVSFAGDSFLAAGDTLKVLSILIIVSIGTNFFGMQVLYARNLERYVFQSLLVGAVICIFLNILITPIYKHNGAALSTVMAELGILAFQLYIIKCKRLRVFHNLWNKIRKGLFSLILFFLSIYLLELCFHNENKFQYVTIVSMFSVIVYPLILFIVREPVFVRIIEGIKK
ncbi:flippase [Vibrio navarrensis]|uniref:flippase n=1 Tax=Vibrio navarrensis TaxID=29495 RepID=UPI0018698722|nr:flippase [Vibrio navarrensis]MBE4618701.1 hypothetical protein [Vibrio navarrensis]